MSELAWACVIICGIPANIAAAIICIGDKARQLSSRKIWSTICNEEGIDPLRLQMVLNPPALPRGSGARDPESFDQEQTRRMRQAGLKCSVVNGAVVRDNENKGR